MNKACHNHDSQVGRHQSFAHGWFLLLGIIIISIATACNSNNQDNPPPAEDPPLECMDTNCDTPPPDKFSFTEKLIVFEDNCLIRSSEIYDTSTHLQLLLLAQCSDLTQLYKVNLDYELTVISEFDLLSENCKASYGQVINVSIGQNAEGLFIISKCLIGTSLMETFLRVLNANGEKHPESRIGGGSSETKYTGFNGEFSLAWNSEVRMWGVSGNKSMRRFDQFGKQIGGSVPTEPSHYLHAMNGDWFLTTNGSCHRITKDGILFEKKIPPEQSYHSWTYLWDSLFIAGRYYDGSAIFAFDSTKCQHTEIGKLEKLDGYSGFLHPVKINPLHAIFPYFYKDGGGPSASSSSADTQKNNLRLALYKKTPLPNLVWVVPVVDKVNLSPHAVTMKNNKIYTVYLRNNLLNVSITTGDLN